MEFRTFYEDGLMVFITNADQTDYVAVTHITGRLVVSYKGSDVVNEVNGNRIINDGSFHRVGCAFVLITNLYSPLLSYQLLY